MAIPTITMVSPVIGSGGGQTLVQVVGTGFELDVLVTFAGIPATLIKVRREGGISIADVLSPPGDPKLQVAISIEVQNLDGPGGSPIASELALKEDAFTYLRFNLTSRPPLVRCVESLLADLRRSVLENSGISASVDWDYKAPGLEDLTAEVMFVDTSRLPNVTLSGPDIEQNTFLRDNVAEEVIVMGPHGLEVQIKRPPFVVDLLFDLIGAAASMQQSVALLNAIIQHYYKHNEVSIDRCAEDPSLGQISFDVDFIGQGRSRLRGGSSDIKVFTWEIRVRGFWATEEDLAFDFTRSITDIDVDIQAI